MTEEIPPCGKNAASSVWLVLARSGKPGERFTIFALGAPWIELRRLEPSGAAVNFALNRPAVMTVRWSEACLEVFAASALEFCAGEGEIIIFAAPDVSA